MKKILFVPLIFFSLGNSCSDIIPIKRNYKYFDRDIRLKHSTEVYNFSQASNGFLYDSHYVHSPNVYCSFDNSEGEILLEGFLIRSRQYQFLERFLFKGQYIEIENPSENEADAVYYVFHQHAEKDNAPEEFIHLLQQLASEKIIIKESSKLPFTEYLILQRDLLAHEPLREAIIDWDKNDKMGDYQDWVSEEREINLRKLSREQTTEILRLQQLVKQQLNPQGGGGFYSQTFVNQNQAMLALLHSIRTENESLFISNLIYLANQFKEQNRFLRDEFVAVFSRLFIVKSFPSYYYFKRYLYLLLNCGWIF